MIIDPAMTLFLLPPLQTINVTENESDNFYHYHDNRVMPSHVDAKLADAEGEQPACRRSLISGATVCRVWGSADWLHMASARSGQT